MIVVNFIDIVKSNSFGSKTITLDIDITNIILHAQFRRDHKNGELVRNCVEGSGITRINPNDFIIDDFIVDFEIGTYYYDCQFTYQSGKIKTYFGGSFNVVQNVTE